MKNLNTVVIALLLMAPCSSFARAKKYMTCSGGNETITIHKVEGFGKNALLVQKVNGRESIRYTNKVQEFDDLKDVDSSWTEDTNQIAGAENAGNVDFVIGRFSSGQDLVVLNEEFAIKLELLTGFYSCIYHD